MNFSRRSGNDIQPASGREICIKLSLRYPARALIVDDYQCALASEMLPAALDRIAELENLIDEPPEEESWQMDMEAMECARENHAGCVNGYLLKKWLLAFRKAQNSNLLRKQENERLTKRIEELEAALVEERAKCLHFCHVGDGEYCPDTLEEADHFKKRHMPEAEDELRAEGKL